MTLSEIEINIVLLEQTLRNSREHLQRCRRRQREADEAAVEAVAGIRRLESAILALRETYLSGVEFVKTVIVTDGATAKLFEGGLELGVTRDFLLKNVKFSGATPEGELVAVSRFVAGSPECSARLDARVSRNIPRKHSIASPENEMFKDFDGYVFKYDAKAGAHKKLAKFSCVDGKYYGKVATC